MDPFLGAAAIGAGTSLLGGLLGQSSQNSARRAAEAEGDANRKLQLDFATAGLQWRAADAMAAYKSTGIHPLAMLGVQGPSYTPVNTVGSGSSPMGESISNAGQNISRAMMASASEKARLSTVSRMDDLTREGLSLDNELRRVRIASEKARLFQGVGPGMPTNQNSIPGQGNAPSIIDINSNLYNPNPVTDTTVPDVSHLRVPGGTYFPAPSRASKELIEDNAYQQFMHAWRNNFMPWIDRSYRAPPTGVPIAPNMEWGYNPVEGYYQRSKPAARPSYYDYEPWQNRRHAY